MGNFRESNFLPPIYYGLKQFRISAQQEKERKAMSLLRPGPLDVTAGSTFSFDELLGLVVDSMQIYGNEITKLRRANEDFKYVT